MIAVGRRVLVIGVGNDDRGDDGIGPRVSRRVRDSAPAGLPAGLEVCEYDGEPVGLLHRWADVDVVIVIDAVRTGAAPGTVVRREVDGTWLPGWPRSASTHALGLAEAIRLGAVLDRLPARLVVFGVEVADCTPGAPLTPAVEAAVDTVAALVLAEVVRS